MARNLHGVIWTRVSGSPQKMGDLVLSGDRISFTYTRDYLACGDPGLCLLGDGSIWGDASVTYPVSERIPVFPRLLSLVPGNNPRNLQRRHYLDLLRAATGREPPPGPETEWRLLTLGGHGGVGHLDVFASDIDAQRRYQSAAGPEPSPSRPRMSGRRSQLWRMLKHEVLDEHVDFDPRVVEAALGPTPSVGGMIPKLLVSMTPGGSRAAFYPPQTPGKQDMVLKIEPPEYTGLLDLEALCLGLHRQAGFEVPDWHRLDQEDLHFLAVERFDRGPEGRPIPLESLFSIIAMGDHRFRETGDILLEELGGIIQRLGEVVNLAGDTGEVLYRRILMALLTGNGDLHLDNLSVLGGVGGCRLAPVYDPAPMRAWPRHDLLSAIPFDPSGHADHALFFLDLGTSLGLSARQARQCVRDALDATSTYAERLMELGRVPLAQRRRLVAVAVAERALMSRQLSRSP